MTIPINSASIYTDLDGLDKLRLSANNKDPEALVAAAKQFEALFVQQMLKSMRDASLAEGAFDNDETRFYMDMYDKQLSLTLSEGKGLGLADMIVKQLSSTLSDPDADKTQSLTQEVQPHSNNSYQQASQIKHKLDSSKIQANDQLSSGYFSTPESFINNIMPFAKQAADKIGTNVKVVLAQAALETGWGKYINRNKDGTSSFNLFNIKADSRWQGGIVNIPSLENIDDSPRLVNSRFRSYSKLEDSFKDYVDFIQSSPRYENAMAVANDSEKFVRELHQAGYATDPEYSNKIIQIINGEVLNQPSSSIKLSTDQTITKIVGVNSDV